MIREQHFTVAVEDGGGGGGTVIRVTRTLAPLESAASLRAATAMLYAALGSHGGARLLLDLRGGPPGRSDSEFELAGEELRLGLVERCARVAVLVRSQAGRLQIRRVSRRPDGSEAHVFLDEREALAFLRS